MNDSPIFIIGQPRSGTTLIQRVLNQADGVCISGEHMGLLKGLLKQSRDALTHKDVDFFFPPIPYRDCIDLYRYRLKDPKYFSASANGIARSWINGALMDFILAIAHPSRKEGAMNDRWGFKEVKYGFEDGDAVFRMLTMFWPKAKFILITRNPLDQITSAISRGWWSDDVGEMEARWETQAKTFLQVHKDERYDTNLVRYESFDSFEYVKGICQWSSVDVPDDKIQLIMDTVTGATPNRQPLSDEDQAVIAELAAGETAQAIYPTAPSDPPSQPADESD